MKRKILIVLLGLVVLSQLPFAYRRYRLGRLQKAIQQLESQRITPPSQSEYVDYQGVIHVHSSLGGHSTGNFAELIAAAKANQLDFVIMTEHPQAEFDTSAMTLSGVHAGVLFVNGNEVATASGDRLLLIPGSADSGSASSQSTKEFVGQRLTGTMTFVAYPTESHDWSASSVSGVEVYNLFSNARQYNPALAFFDSLWSHRSYPDLMFANFFVRPSENLRSWDEAAATLSRYRFVAIAGNDAHSNVGLSVNDASGNQWLGVKLDPYERSFRVVRTHVLIKKDKPLTREYLLQAINTGHCYFSFDIFGDAKGFGFVSSRGVIMGGREGLVDGLQLRAYGPLASRFVLYKDGVVAGEKSGTSVDFPISAIGNYRIEVYLDSLPKPFGPALWVVSNPIRVVPISELERF